MMVALLFIQMFADWARCGVTEAECRRRSYAGRRDATIANQR
jgi:hypothetical protein